MKANEVLELLRAARQVASQRYPFVASMIYAMHLRSEPTRHEGLVAAVSQHGTLYWNDEELRKIDPKHYPGIIYHEAKHLLLKHFKRAEIAGVGPGGHKPWNVAADIEINQAIRRDQALSLPDFALYPETFDLPPGLVAEEYYDMIRDHEDAQSGAPSGSGSDGVGREWEGDSEEPHLTEADIEVIRHQVANEYVEWKKRYQGATHADYERLVKEVLNPKVDWRVLLAGHIRAAIQEGSGADDYSYSRPSRRYAGSGFVYPRLRGRIPKVALVLDTSGSMSAQDLSVALSEVKGVIEAAGDAVDWIAYDTEVASSGRTRRLQDIKLAGGGGTDMSAAIMTAVERSRPDVIVVMTDGYTQWPPEPVGPHVIAAIINTRQTPPGWIKTVYVGEENG